MAMVKVGGAERELRLTVGALRRFERRSGVRLFKALAAGIAEMQSSPSKGMSEADGIKLFTGVFPGIEEVAAFAFECCIPPKEQRELGFDEFCEGIGIDSMSGIVRAILEEISEFMPEAPETVEGGSDADAPLGQSGGPKSMR